MSAKPDEAEDADIRPIVRKGKGRAGPILFGVTLAIGAGTLFGALNARRFAVTSPATTPHPDSTAGVIVTPPTLYIPEEFSRPEGRYEFGQPLMRPNAPFAWSDTTPRPASAVNRVTQTPPASGTLPFPPAVTTAEVQLQPTRPGLIYQAQGLPRSPDTGFGSAGKDGASRASRLPAPSMTVTQGTVVQAVLETALDSNHPGFARAIVSRDVSSFDGTRVLIPKGSRLFGEYKADVNRGQNRALIQWHRLTRPDGTIIDVDSPSADPLGRAGVKGRVNTHFFERFGGAILQSVLDAGVQVAAREASGGTVILALPNSTQVAPVVNPDQVRPTIKIRQGTSVSVLVVRDLDFSDVEQ